MIIKTADSGSVSATGWLSGYVVSDSGHYALPGVALSLTGIVDGDTIMMYDTSGMAGEFTFSEIYFGTGADFELNAENPVGYSIINSPVTYSFSSSNHVYRHELLLGDKLILPTGTQSISLSSVNVSPVSGMDALKLTWSYTAPDTALFIISRNGNLFAILNDTGTGNTNSFIDYSGVPGTLYTYILWCC